MFSIKTSLNVFTIIKGFKNFYYYNELLCYTITQGEIASQRCN